MTYIFSIILIICIMLATYLVYKNKRYKKYMSTAIAIIIVLWTITIIVLFPKNTVQAGLNGLLTWFNVVLPSLLPFFIVSEILIGLGVVNFIGALLQPLMRPIFNVPGEGSFALAMSITSGYPVGAKLVSQLRSQGSINQVEGQRLISFCSTSGPLFMIGAVAVGMFNNPSLGALIVIAHYLGSFTVGFVFKFFRRSPKERSANVEYSFKIALKKLIIAREKDGRSIGTLMGDAVREAFNTMFMVGGFIILYSVIIEILKISKILHIVAYMIQLIIPFDFDTNIIIAFLSGIVEMTNGCQMIASVESSSLLVQSVMVSFLIAWSGFSIHSQAITMISKTDINLLIYFTAKILHGIFSSIYTFILYFLVFEPYITTSFNYYNNQALVMDNNLLSVFNFSLKIGIVSLIIIFSFSILFCVFYRPIYSSKNK